MASFDINSDAARNARHAAERNAYEQHEHHKQMKNNSMNGLAVRKYNKYIVAVRGVKHTVIADRADVNHENGVLFFGLDTINQDVTQPVCAFREWDWWTQDDKPLNIKTEDK